MPLEQHPTDPDKLRYVRAEYNLPKPWVGLTQDEPMQIWDGIIKYAPSEMRIKDFAQAIEAKLKEKNNAA